MAWRTRWEEVGGYDQRIIEVDGIIIDVTCTCMWTTMEMSRHQDFKDRRLCKHIKEILNENK